MRLSILGLGLLSGILLIGAGCGQTPDTAPLSSEADPPEITSPVSTPEVAASDTIHDGTDTLAINALISPGVMNVKTPAGKTEQVPTKNYTAAMATYGTNGARFQFVGCSATPGTMSLKRGISFMLDNRNAEAHTIAIGQASYRLKGYDYAIVTVQKAGVYPITCDGGGSGQLSVEG